MGPIVKRIFSVKPGLLGMAGSLRIGLSALSQNGKRAGARLKS